MMSKTFYTIGSCFVVSLSGAELERMFEDDSTCNFEKLEMRLKTPKVLFYFTNQFLHRQKVR